jgi:hypothetical protein
MTALETTGPMPQESMNRKVTWPLYSLQSLPPSRFAEVVGKVIDGRYELLNARATASHK